MRLLLFLAVIIQSVSGCAGSASAAAAELVVEGTDLIVRLEDGQLLKGEGLIGLKLLLRHEGADVEARIDGVEHDEAAIGGPLTLYRLSTPDPESGERRELCLPDARGRRLGFPVSDKSGFKISCTSGAEGKCVLLGYRPWDTRPTGAPMADLHRACVHMMRADYGGADRPSTLDGTLIDIEDLFGIQTFDAVAGMRFEAAWGTEGAVCVARPRIAMNIGLEDIAGRYPRLADALGPAACTEEILRKDARVLLLNRSYPGPHEGQTAVPLR